jgi:hypothetical protein
VLPVPVWSRLLLVEDEDANHEWSV